MKLKFTKLQIVLEFVSLAVAVSMVVHLAMLWGSAPQTVPMHYDAAGNITRYDSKSGLLFVPIMAILIYAGITLIEFFPGVWNIPNTPDDRKEDVLRATRTMILLLKTVVVALFWYISVVALSMQPMHPAFLPVCLVATFAPIVFYLIYVRRITKKTD